VHTAETFAVDTAVPLPEILAGHAVKRPDETAFTLLRNGEEPIGGVTWRRLHRAVLARAQYLAGAGHGGGTAVLMYPNGVEFVRGWFACMTAGVAGAPVQVPSRVRGLERLRAVADDAGTTLVLTTREVREQLLADFGGLPALRGLEIVATDGLPDEPDGEPSFPGAGPKDVALLQYTSGSTGTPKGVMVTHANFWANAASIDRLWPCGDDGTAVSWLPVFHDMGLMFGVVLPVWAGMPSYLMTPEAFVRRPARWLEALSRFRGTHAAAPNFAYGLCARAAAGAEGLDLSSWRCAVNGAEPVRMRTIGDFTGAFAPHGLAPEAVAPAYGLAENTLKVSGDAVDRPPHALGLSAAALGEGRVAVVGNRDAEPVIDVVSCGVIEPGTPVRIVDPVTGRLSAPDRVGEIRVGGPSVAAGYLGRPEESEAVFRARIADAPEEGPFLRTGDLGFVREGELFVTGRLKDVLVVKGRNHYPQDVEHTVERGHEALHPSCAAAFSVEDGTRESLVLVVEVDGRALRAAGADGVVRAVREAVLLEHRLKVDDVVLIRRGTLPRTTSGKVRRSTCREQYTAGTLRRAVTV
jgi:acyl-CoA synthetase (AMP-forming)/AMP-acid ligase II